jgi:predicted NodU family carbamoyl transferase
VDVYTLGVKPSRGKRAFIQYWGNHNPGACLLRDGDIIAAVEEERFTREKLAEDTFPYNSIRYVLDAEDIGLADVDTLAIGHDPISKWRNKKNSCQHLRHSMICTEKGGN